jgi:hypothetical protein
VALDEGDQKDPRVDMAAEIEPLLEAMVAEIPPMVRNKNKQTRRIVCRKALLKIKWLRERHPTGLLA